MALDLAVHDGELELLAGHGIDGDEHEPGLAQPSDGHVLGVMPALEYAVQLRVEGSIGWSASGLVLDGPLAMIPEHGCAQVIALGSLPFAGHDGLVDVPVNATGKG